jgi:hypothetical protein
MKVSRRSFGIATAQALASALSGAASGAPLVFCCRAENDVFTATGGRCSRYGDAADAVRHAPPGAGVLVLADGYPDVTATVNAELFEEAREKRLRLYIEYPSWLPGIHCEAPRRTRWERAVVASRAFGDDLPVNRILAIHGCRFVPVQAGHADIVAARVAGFDSAVYGLPGSGTSPILFEYPAASAMVATTKLSQFVTARYAPAEAWIRIWKRILDWAGGAGTEVSLKCSPAVAPSYSRLAMLPAGCEADAFHRGLRWYRDARLLIHPSWAHKEVEAIEVEDRIADGPALDWPAGDGSLGMWEGFNSSIRPDGSQPVRWWLRADCMAESSFALALSGGADTLETRAAANLNDFVYWKSTLAQGPRADSQSPSFGLAGWNQGNEGIYYGDDNARMMLGTMGAAAALGSGRWDEPLLRCLLANLRTTGPQGFRGELLREAALQKAGWRHYFTEERVHYSPHFECYLWATYLWAWDKTGYRPFLDRAGRGIRATMAAYPGEWRWTNGMQQERARMLLPLAWLVRVDPSAEHRGWLSRMARELLAFQDRSGAIREEIGSEGKGRYRPPQSNAEYGTREAPLIQANGDPLCDLLYTTNFAFLGLHEAAAATGETMYRDATAKLAEFLCRVQVRSTRRPELNGAWFRAFDFGRWDYWASNADAGWGAWSIETGWTQAWIAAVLGLRQRKSSLWELTAKSGIAAHVDKLTALMLPGE